jgi:mannosyltransferase
LIIHLHFHSRTTGVTKSIESIFPALAKYAEARVFGYGIRLPRIGLFSLLRLVYSGVNTVIHAHRNNELIFALFIRLLGGRFRLIATRHSETRPSRFTTFLLKKADVIISLTASMSAKLPQPNTIVRHGVDTELFSPGEKKKIEGVSQNNLIIAVGRVRPAKGQLMILKSVEPLLRENRNWGLVIIGKTDDKEYAAEILSRAAEKKIASQVHFVPETRDIAGIYRAANVVVIASSTEGFSLVCLEAPACGIITVATEGVGVHSEVLTHGKNGFLFPPGDEEALRKILSDIISASVTLNPVEIRQNIIDNWDLEKSALGLLKVYGIYN